MTNVHLLDMDAVLSTPGFFDFLGDIDCDYALDSRDAEPFDAQWMAAFDEIDGDPAATIGRQDVDVLRERAFKLAFRASGNADVAACVSDDIELVARSRLSGRINGWPTRILWDAYKSGRFPCWPFCLRRFPVHANRANRDYGATCTACHRIHARSPANMRFIPPQSPDCQTM